MKAKKKRLRKWARVTLGVIGSAAAVALFIYIFVGGVLQSSYRYAPPSTAEIQEAQEGGMWSWITLAKY